MLASARNSLARLLRWTEQYTKTDMIYLASGGFWLTLGQVAAAVAAFCLSIAFAWFVSKDTYGTYRFLTSIFWTLSALTLTGLPTVVSRAIAQGFTGSYIRSVSLSIFWGLPMSAAAFATAAYYYVQGNMLLSSGVLLMALFGPFLQASFLFGSILEGNRDFKRSAIFGIILNVIPALLILSVITLYSNPVIFFAAYLLGNIGAGLLLSYLTYRIYRPSGDVGPDIQHLSKHFTVMNLLSTISQQIDKLLVFHYLGAAQLAVYAFAIAMPEQIKAISSSISTLAFPKFAVKSASELKNNFWKRLGLLMLFMSVVACGYIFLAPIVFSLLFPAYLQSVIYSQVFALSLIIVANVMPITLLQAHAAKRELYIFNIAYPIFQIGMLAVLIPLYGIMGAVVARILARAFNLILGSLLVRGYFEKIV